MTTNENRSTGAVAAGVIAITATYVYFLLFAEFAFLELTRAVAADPAALQLVMGALGAGGVIGSLVTAWRFRLERFRLELMGGFAGCALTAVWALGAHSKFQMSLVGAGVGLALGWTTVTLVSGLRATLGPKRLGWWCGVGTGFAYAWCNVPWVFTASAIAQTAIAVFAAVVGLAAASRIGVPMSTPVTTRTRGRVRVSWIAVLLALVWLDSAAFYVIQHADALKAGMWAGDWRLVGNALSHLALACAAGWALDRGAEGRVGGTAAVLLLGACLVLPPVSDLGASILYTAGVSVYSTLLVFYPAREGRPGLAAAIYAVAGWGGSALGIGMAQELHEVPAWFIASAAVVIAVALWSRWRWLAAIAVVVSAGNGLRAEHDPTIALGREVYVAEGCIHCHSQYVRPRVATEVERWGPGVPLEERLSETPPLFGNRRQGPDLAEVGNRRSAEWQRLHLQEPRAVVPGSRMPSYAHLFRGDGKRGDALVAYLASLGREHLGERVREAQRWIPAPGDSPPDSAHAASLFTQLCANCHGAGGHGDGALAEELSVHPPDWSRDPWRSADERQRYAVERIVKFGLPGTPMPGHEYLADADVVALAQWVRRLHVQPALP